MEKTIFISVGDYGCVPEYTSESAAGADLRSALEEPITIQPGERKLIKTGLKVALPKGYMWEIRPRSGLALKNGITVLNTPGTVDADYRGEVGVILINLSTEPFIVNPGDRIAQAVLVAYQQAIFEEVTWLDNTERGEGGFGHSGVK